MRLFQVLARRAIAVSIVSLFTAFSTVFAGGFQLFEEDLTGFGDVHAGDAATSESAGAQFYNPAAMTHFDALSISTGGVGVLLNTQVDSGSSITNESNGFVLPIDSPVSGNTQNIVPNFSIVKPLSDKWAVGFSESSSFGLSTNYSNGTPSSSRTYMENYATETTIETINLNPNVAYALSPQWSAGVGFDALHASAVYDNASLTNSLDDWGYGFNLGVYYTPSDSWHFGLGYRSKIDLTLSGDSTASGVTTQASADLPMPATTYFSATQKMSSKWNMLYSVFYTQWDVIDNLILEDSAAGDLEVPQDFSNAWFFSVGTTYHLNDQWLLRGGLGYDQSPTKDGERDARMPDSDRFILGVGATLRPNQRMAIDIGYQHVFMQDADLGMTIYDDGDAYLSMTGVSSSSADLMGLQVSYQFS
ncbi:MAG: hypothetical protein CL816_00175 [Coxiellaceae bacterium]|nr:hypothetical protein [Coxiellaceae bacterium]|tara:strand:- start:1130 stop:2383 length:1254 start_codon:yes stop_codon:yes gene_type:complete